MLPLCLGGAMSPAQTRLTALLAVDLDTGARSGELVELRTTDLAVAVQCRVHAVVAGVLLDHPPARS